MEKKMKVVISSLGSVEIKETDNEHEDEQIEGGRIYNDWTDKKKELSNFLVLDVSSRNMKKKLTQNGVIDEKADHSTVQLLEPRNH